MLELIMPKEKNSWASQIAHVEVAREKLRLESREMGRRKDQGLISEQEWRTYLDQKFHPKSLAISKAMNQLKKSPPQADLDQVNLTDDFKIVSIEKP